MVIFGDGYQFDISRRTTCNGRNWIGGKELELLRGLLTVGEEEAVSSAIWDEKHMGSQTIR